MIPSDLAASLRILTEASLLNNEQPVPGLHRAREIQSQLPDLVPGSRFFATLQRALPDGTFRAIVAGQQMTLALDQPVKTGDTLELVVTHRSPNAIFAQLAHANATASHHTSSFQALLSPAARLISSLLTGRLASEPTSLAGNRPLLEAPPLHSAQLTPLLRQAIGQSGLFYESHLQAWLAGKLDMAALLKEPQGQQQSQFAPSTPSTPGTSPAATGTSTPTSTPPSVSTQQITPAPGQNPALSAPTAESAIREHSTAILYAASSSESVTSSHPGNRSIVPERLLPILQQQLEALGTHQYTWQGQIWPGQYMEWQIEDPRDGEGKTGGEETPTEWNTTLRIKLPTLGALEAQLQLTTAGIALRLKVTNTETATALATEQPRLEEALAAAGITLTGMVVETTAS